MIAMAMMSWQSINKLMVLNLNDDSDNDDDSDDLARPRLPACH